jgi:membrane-associated protease RseP (regulator of RpoE activity)
MTRWIALAAAYLARITVHESGHALAVCACGGQVKEFAIFALPPPVIPAGSFADAQLSFVSLAGSGLFFALWFPFTLLKQDANE